MSKFSGFRKLKWTCDCQGKMDYDGNLGMFYVSSRTYPSTGKDDKASGNSTIYENAECIKVVCSSPNFEFDSQMQVNVAIENWVQERAAVLMEVSEELVKTARERIKQLIQS